MFPMIFLKMDSQIITQMIFPFEFAPQKILFWGKDFTWKIPEYPSEELGKIKWGKNKKSQ